MDLLHRKFLGLQPKNTSSFLAEELTDWAKLGVEGHFHAKRPWLYYHKFTKKHLARLVGAKPEEVVAMNQLTVNLHLMLVSFYKPSGGRFKIITEANAFPSDQYALESQIRLHGLHPDAALIEVKPRDGEHTLRTEDIVKTIKDNADQLSLVIFGGVQYYTGQFFDIAAITKAAHDAGAYAGFDLAHAVGNLPLSLHDHGVDFAVWCSYKYLNSGPGGVAGAFVHEKHFDNRDSVRPETTFVPGTTFVTRATVRLPRAGRLVGIQRRRAFSNEEGFRAHAWCRCMAVVEFSRAVGRRTPRVAGSFQ